MYKLNSQVLKTVFLILLNLIIFSCSNNDDDLFVTITVNEGPNGDIGGDFTGNGGSGERTITWLNNDQTADYNADITEYSNGSFKMTIKDANGDIVLERSLQGNVEPDTFSGYTNLGQPGLWTVTIELQSFDGDGSYSLSEGD